jgi:hypothetical protein
VRSVIVAGRRRAHHRPRYRADAARPRRPHQLGLDTGSTADVAADRFAGGAFRRHQRQCHLSHRRAAYVDCADHQGWCHQFIHEDDIADIVSLVDVAALKADYEILNGAPPGETVKPCDAAQTLGKRLLRVHPPTRSPGVFSRLARHARSHPDLAQVLEALLLSNRR